MLLYQRCKTTDLIAFATNRKLEIQATTKHSKKSTRQTLIQALKHADSTRTFDFLLDLPPELRNIIYRELLVPHDSFKCYPQILRTCKLVHDEASNILYGDNLIEIKVYPEGIYVHGVQVAISTTERHIDVPRLMGNHVLHSIEWPQFIRRAQFLRFTVMKRSKQETLLVGSLYFIIHSFCNFLHGDHRLRSLEVNLKPLRKLFASWEAAKLYHKGVSTALYPLRLLSKIKRLRVPGISKKELTSLLTPSKYVIEAANRTPKPPKRFLETMEILRCRWDARKSELPSERFDLKLQLIVRHEVELKLAGE